MARKSDWSQDSTHEWTFSRGGVQAMIDWDEYDGDLLEGDYHAVVHDNDQVVMDAWYCNLEVAKAEVESIVRGIV